MEKNKESEKEHYKKMMKRYYEQKGIEQLYDPEKEPIDRYIESRKKIFEEQKMKKEIQKIIEEVLKNLK